MNRGFSALQILVAAVIAAIATLAVQFFLQVSDATLLSALAISTFLSGVLTPFITFYAQQKRAQRPRARVKRPIAQGNMRTLYVGNLPFKINEEEITKLFSQHGAVNEVRLVKDRRTGRKKGYGFIEMEAAGAERALAKLNEQVFEGRTLKIRAAHAEQDDA